MGRVPVHRGVSCEFCEKGFGDRACVCLYIQHMHTRMPPLQLDGTVASYTFQNAEFRPSRPTWLEGLTAWDMLNKERCSRMGNLKEGLQ